MIWLQVREDARSRLRLGLDGRSGRPCWRRRCHLLYHLLRAVLDPGRSRRPSRGRRHLFGHLLLAVLHHGGSGRASRRRCGFLNHHLLCAVLDRGRDSCLLRLASRRRLRDDAGGLSSLAEPPPLWLRRLPERQPSWRSIKGVFSEAKC